MEQGLIPANERVYELLTLGTSLIQAIEGDGKSHSLHYVDWQHPERNLSHVTDEFPVQRPGSHETRRPDVVGFVNGIPLVVIECKRPDLGDETYRCLAACFPKVQHTGVAYPRLAIRVMSTRWGSTSPSGRVTLNLKLIQMPRACIDYVIYHELCHLKEPNHSSEYYRLLDRVLPDWRERRDRLNGLEFG